MTNLKLTKRIKFAAMAGVSSAAITKACKGKLKPAIVGDKIDANHPAAIAYLKSKDEPEITATGYDPYFEEAIRLCVAENNYTIRFIKKSFSIGTDRASKIVALMKAARIIPKPNEVPPVIQYAEPEPEKPPAPARVISGYTARNNSKKSEAMQKINEGTTLHEIPADIEKFVDMTLRELIQRFGSDIAFGDWLKATKTIEEINAKRLKNAHTRGELVNRHLVKTQVIEPINNAHTQLLTDGAKTLARRVTTLHAAGETVEDIEKFIIEQISSFIKPVKAKVARALRNV